MIRDFLICGGSEVVVRSSLDFDLLDDHWIHSFSGVVISPGPGHPSDSHVSLQLIKSCSARVPLLGICLGMQCLALCSGGSVYYLSEPKHGVVSTVETLTGSSLFSSLPSSFSVCRYHSVAVASSFAQGSGLEVSAVALDDGVVMAIEDEDAMAYGIQFHPESVASEFGSTVFSNFIKLL